jgi:hypothetical protein
MFGNWPFVSVWRVFVAGIVIALSAAPGASQVPCGQRVVKEPVFRAPFVLRLQVDSQRSYEEHFDRVPFVAEDGVYLFAGDSVGINVTVSGNRLCEVTYQPDASKADVDFKFTQEKSPNGFVMSLMIRNRLPRTVSLDALMTVPGEKRVYKTTVLPVAPKRTNAESWPHPIVQLLLQNFRVSDSTSE